MTEKEIMENLEFVRFNMGCEGFELTEKNIQTGKEILRGKISGDEAVKRIIKEHGFKTV
ncbi:antitoxin VbhA family protein (plasmid) [Oscillospiraceae bacterium PP1C4]